MARRVRANNPTKRVRRKPAEVEIRHVAHPRVWELAIKLADGDMTRLTVESYGKVTILIP